MNKANIFAIIFLALLWVPGTRASSAAPDSLLSAGINSLADSFLEGFPLSDYSGLYNHEQKDQFLELFHPEARIYNFIPGTEGYQRPLALLDYVESVRNFLEDNILQPNNPRFQLTNLVKGEREGLFFGVLEVNCQLVIFTNDFLWSERTEVSLLVNFQADTLGPDFIITGIRKNISGITGLSFRVMGVGREPAKSIPLDFSYTDPETQEVITRRRHTDEQGRVEIGLLPSETMLKIIPPEGYAFVFTDDRLVSEWEKIPIRERLLFLESRTVLAAGRSWFRAGGQFAMALSHREVEANFDFLMSDYRMVISPSVGFFIDYSHTVVRKSGFNLLAGTGVEYVSTSFISNIGSIEQEFPALSDIDMDEFDLLLTGSQIEESYTYASWRIPVFLTYRQLTGSKWVPAIDLTTLISYSLGEIFSVKSTLGAQTTTGYYPKYDILLFELPFYHYSTTAIPADKPIEESYRQDFRFAVALQLAVNISLVKHRLWLQPLVVYDMQKVGQKHQPELVPGRSASGYHYLPSLGYGQVNMGAFRMGAGLLFSF